MALPKVPRAGPAALPIYEGKIIWVGPVSEIDSSGSAHVDQFIHGRADQEDLDRIREGFQPVEA